MSKHVLCVGGKHDRMKIEFPDHVCEGDFTKVHCLPLRVYTPGNACFDETCDVEDYVYMNLIAFGTKYEIAVICGMTITEAFARIVAGYWDTGKEG